VAGAAALLLHSNPEWSPADVKSALVTTAKRPVFDHVAGTEPTGPLTRGGGRIEVAAADGVSVTSDPATVSFGLFQGNAPANGTVVLTLADVAGDGANCGVGTDDARLSASPAAVTLAAGGTATVTLSFTGGRAAQTPSGDYGGDVTLTCDGETLLVPWWTRVDRGGKP
jgi:minor extracellular serine protease Vpr